MRYTSIPRFTAIGNYAVDVDFEGLEDYIKRYTKTYQLLMCPDFQRGHVWTEEQQIKYIEFVLSGGYSGKDIFFNCPGWMGKHGQMVLIDGLQRLTAALRFIRNEIKVYGSYYKEYDYIPNSKVGFIFHVNNLKTRREELTWYIQLNEGGIVHTKEELDRVKKLLKEEQKG